MKKYLVITREKDFISNSRDALKHLKNSSGLSCMVYDKDGWWISFARRNDDGVPKRENPFPDGEPRLYYAKIIKTFPVGTVWEDVSDIVPEYMD